jgi:hypothetical protein
MRRACKHTSGGAGFPHPPEVKDDDPVCRVAQDSEVLPTPPLPVKNKKRVVLAAAG